jgi:hypothetical protein
VSARYLAALGLTLAVELPLVLLVLRRMPRARVLAAFLVGNLLTHLSIHFGLARLVTGPVAFEVTAEAWALAAEAGLYFVASRPRSPWLALVASALANGASYLVGLAVFG